MSVNSELYTALSPIAGVDSTFDTKTPDDLLVTSPIVVFQRIADVPTTPINGVIIGREQRWQISVYAPDIASARTAADSVIAALQGLTSGAIKWCEYEQSFELYDMEIIPPLYHIAIDFVVQS
jgi:hypothetical protein